MPNRTVTKPTNRNVSNKLVTGGLFIISIREMMPPVWGIKASIREIQLLIVKGLARNEKEVVQVGWVGPPDLHQGRPVRHAGTGCGQRLRVRSSMTHRFWIIASSRRITRLEQSSAQASAKWFRSRVSCRSSRASVLLVFQVAFMVGLKIPHVFIT